MGLKAVKVHLDHWAIVGPQNVAYGPSAHQMADLFGHILGMIASSFNFLRHGNNVEALLARFIMSRLKVPQKDQVAQPVQFAVGAEHTHSTIQAALSKGLLDVSKHLPQM